MEEDELMNRKMRLLTTLLVIVVGGILIWKSTANRLDGLKASDDSLSMALAERWGSGLPKGYEKEVADDLDTCGCLFARLTYAESVEDLLANWETVDSDLATAFDTVVETQLAAEIPEAHRNLLETGRPAPEDDWIGYSMTEGEAELVLLYDPGEQVMYVAERQPMS